MKIKINLLEKKELSKIHDCTLKVLEDPGMKIMDQTMLKKLKDKRAKVDFNSQVVSFPPFLIEETISLMQEDIKKGRVPIFMNGVTSEITDSDEIQAKFGGACTQYFDFLKKEYRYPTELDLINMVKLGEAISEVKKVGNPVVYLKDNDGKDIEPRMQRIKTAAIIAKYTTKPGPTEVWNAKELEYLIKIGEIVKGNLDNYLKDPCFITAKETIAPLILENKAAEVLLALAAKKLPCTIIPMPISGITSPVSLFGNTIIGNSEILGTATAIKVLYPEAMIVGGVISGSMNMATGTANFSTPEATLQDLALAELHESIYGFNFGMGGYPDAKYPGIQNSLEKEFKYLILAFSKRHTYPVGLVNWGKCFSPEQAVIDIQIIQNIHKFLDEIIIPDEDDVLSLIRKVGIGGSFLQEDNTLFNYKKHLMVPELFDHTLSKGYKEDIKNDVLEKAHDKVQEILLKDDLYKISIEKSREIDRIVKNAEKHL